MKDKPIGEPHPELPSPLWPHGLIVKYSADGTVKGKYNQKYYRVERAIIGITPDNAEGKARDILIRALQAIQEFNGGGLPLYLRTHEMKEFIGDKMFKQAGLR